MPGASFDRVADHYDQSRGGERRGRAFATALVPWIVGERVAELGIGTGAVAVGLHERGFRVAGFDLSPAMLTAAVERVGPRVAVPTSMSCPYLTMRSTRRCSFGSTSWSTTHAHRCARQRARSGPADA